MKTFYFYFADGAAILENLLEEDFLKEHPEASLVEEKIYLKEFSSSRIWGHVVAKDSDAAEDMLLFWASENLDQEFDGFEEEYRSYDDYDSFDDSYDDYSDDDDYNGEDYE